MIYWWCFEYVWIFLIFLIKLLNMKHLSIEHWTWTTNILEDHWTNVENISFKASGGQWFRRLSWKRKMFNWKWRRHFGDDGHLWIPCGFAVSSINMPIWIHKTMIFFWDMGQPRYLDKESFKHLVFCYIFWYHYIYIYINPSCKTCTQRPKAVETGARGPATGLEAKWLEHPAILRDQCLKQIYVWY